MVQFYSSSKLPTVGSFLSELFLIQPCVDTFSLTILSLYITHTNLHFPYTYIINGYY